MLVWTKNFPRKKKLRGYLRILKARMKFFDYLSFDKKSLKIITRKGYQKRLREMRNKHAGKRCFIIGNGPSLKDMDISKLKNEFTIGANGLYKNFKEWGFHTNYLLFEDIEQTEIRGNDIHKIKGPIKMAALYNAYAFKADKKTYFFNSRYADRYFWDNLFPKFSNDFGDIVYLGSTITYIAMQLAFHLGFNEVYIIGVDHDYGELPKRFPPGKIKITEENIHLVKGLHANDNYYKVGDLIGVPYVELQDKAYARAREFYDKHGVVIKNAGIGGKLEAFERCDFNNLFR